MVFKGGTIMDNENENKITLLSIVAMIPFWVLLGAMIGWRIAGNQGLCFGIVLGFIAGKIFNKWVQKEKNDEQ